MLTDGLESAKLISETHYALINLRLCSLKVV